MQTHPFEGAREARELRKLTFSLDQFMRARHRHWAVLPLFKFTSKCFHSPARQASVR